MTEFKDELKAYFKELDVSLVLYPESNPKRFSSLNRFYSFLEKEKNFWEECTSGETSKIKAHFYTAYNHLNSMIQQQEKNLEQAKQQLNQSLNLMRSNTFPCVFSTTEVGKFVKERYAVHHLQADAAIHYLLLVMLNGVHSTLNQGTLHYTDYFNGLMMSMAFKSSEIAVTLDERESKLVPSLKEQYREVVNDFEGEFDQYSSTLTEWQQNIHTTTEAFLDDKQKKLEDLHTLYEEKLRLESPAKYWENYSEEHELKGKLWKNWAVGSVIGFSVFILIILFLIPTSNKLDFMSVRSILLMTVLVSIGFFLVNFFIKLSTSSYHLAKDAKERYQLTYVYLSLLKEEAVSKDERSIVLQSIFSRADTGLLKGDSSPTLPDGLTAQLLKSTQTRP